MKWVGCLCLAITLQGCFFKRYYNDSTWAYFEQWDTNESMTIDKEEFVDGYMSSELFRKLSPKSQPISYEDFSRFLSGYRARSNETPRQELPVEPFDSNGDKAISGQEMAVAMFALADDNGDNSLTSLEFYDWEVYL